MQQVIEEILKTEEDCARRLDGERKAMEQRRAEIESENAARIQSFREEAEAKAAEAIRDYQAQVHKQTESEITRAREDAARELESNQELLDTIVGKIVELIVGSEREV